MEDRRYFIDQKWYQERGRSLNVLLESRLCSACREKQVASQGLDKIWARFKSCCSKQEGFFSPRLSLKERVFRLFLVKGNTPLTVEEILGELAEQEEGGSLSPTTLQRLLDKDHYYGFAVVSSSVPNVEAGKAAGKS